MSGIAISARGVRAGYGRREVLRGLDLELAEGTATALVGANGCGKTTFLRIVAGCLAPSAGEVRVLGLDAATRGAEIRGAIGYVPDALALPPWMRVRDHLRFLRPFYRTWSAARECSLLSRFGLDPAARVRELSRGGREKLALVAALAHEPRLLVLDEPFSGLDPAVRREVLAALIGELGESSRTVLFVSHSMADVERLADRIAILDSGRIVWHGEAEEARFAAGCGAPADLDTALARALSISGKGGL